LIQAPVSRALDRASQVDHRPARTLTRFWRPLVLLCWVTTVSFLATYHLASVPVTWFDEGVHLHVPKTLIQLGTYADISSEGFRYFGPTIAVGPTVMLPIAVMFKLAGVGLLQARLVIVAYFLAAIGVFWVLARSAYGEARAVLAVTMLVLAPGVDFLLTGRQVVGEVPAFFSLALGILLWWRCLERRAGVLALVGAGIPFGLAAMTKNDVGLVLVPTFAVLAGLDLKYYRQFSPRYYLVPLVMAGLGGVSIYLVLVPPLLASGDPRQFLSLFRNASAGAIFVFAPERMRSSLKFLASADVYFCWGLPGLLYGWFQARQRNLAGVQQAFLAVFATLGLGWFAFASIGWPRYAFAELGLLALPTAQLLGDVIRALARSDTQPIRVGGSRLSLLAVAATFALVLTLGNWLEARVVTVVATPNTAPEDMAAYLNTHVPTSTIIETWEPELGFLSDHDYHYPPPAWLDRAVRARWLHGGATVTGYDPLAEASPSYILVGPFGKYTGIYDGTLTRLRPTETLVASFGEYDLYRVR
jgi:hypothetical protein